MNASRSLQASTPDLRTASARAGSHQTVARRPRRYRRSAALAVLCFIAGLALSLAARAADEDVGYQPPAGTPFFLLADAAYGSQDEARVRIQAAPDTLEALDAAGGLEIAVYRVDQPLDFLRRQRNLHRIELAAARRPEGLANTLDYLWSSWWLRARQTWQAVFDGRLRETVTGAAPALKTAPDIAATPNYRHASPYRAPAGLDEVERFRYPVSQARPIAPPAGLNLEGSSSNFIEPTPGNVHVPLGRRAPGLYVVEAGVGRQRALALLFVADTMAVTKTSAEQFFVWTAARSGGRPVAADIVWTDLNGVLGSGRSDGDGVLVIARKVPETSYAFGVDQAGGVFISENFYYDSEIHAKKLYIYTDRPLYRPGDEVHVRVQGREFESAVRSRALPSGRLDLTVLDAAGQPVHREALAYDREDGATARFRLPREATAGGYDIRIKEGEDEHGAAFRVAPYVKPSFEVLIEPEGGPHKAGTPVRGRIRLAYADGRPIAAATLELSARAQRLSMVDGDLRFAGAFPLQIDQNQVLKTDAAGEARFELPAVAEASRLVLSVLAEDGASQRVRASQEILIERAAASWRLRPARQFAGRDELVQWTLSADESGAAARGPTAGAATAVSAAGTGAAAGAGAGAGTPTRWVALHQESQTRSSGLISDPARLDLRLAEPGSYTIELRDAADQVLGAAPFRVTGGALKPPLGAVEIVFDQPRYRPGDIARALITLPLPVDDALITLERDRVEGHGRLDGAGRFAEVRRLSDRQFEATLVVRAEHAPNISFSVAYLAQGGFGFQNAGLVVEQPALDVSVSSAATVFAPGAPVSLDVLTRDPTGKPVPAVLSIAVVDEMVYALQAELAPTVNEFFHHARRNNVRTHSSQAFISYDEAGDALAPSPIRRAHQERATKLLERPRRDERDTALFAAAVRTDEQGRARVEFRMPDALTRWRVTAKAYGRGAADGLVGERRSWLRSDQAIYARWSAPTWARAGDQPRVSATVFNQTADTRALAIDFRIGKDHLPQTLEARPGANFVSVDLPTQTADTTVGITIRSAQGEPTVLDRLETAFEVRPPAWRHEHEQILSITAGTTRSVLALPGDARRVRARVLAPGAAAWTRIADSLIDQPYGCVEQTASRLLPLAWAVRSLEGQSALQTPLRERLASARVRLSSLAGPGASFGWWGPGTRDDLFMSAYAYLADAEAARALGFELPAEHWRHLLTLYRDQAATAPLVTRTWAVWMMRELGLPTATLVDGLVAGHVTEAKDAGRAVEKATDAITDKVMDKGMERRANMGAPMNADSVALADVMAAEGRFSPLDEGPRGRQAALVLAAGLARDEDRPWPASLNEPLAAALRDMAARPSPLGSALLLRAGRRAPTAPGLDPAQVLTEVGADAPTIERALALRLLGGLPALGAGVRDAASTWLPAEGAWRIERSPTGQPLFVVAPDAGVPDQIEWATPAPQALQLALRYESAAPVASRGTPLTLSLERRLWRLVRGTKHLRAEAVAPGTPLATDGLYLDEVVVQAQARAGHALIELALPPGGLLETTTWGVRLERLPGEATVATPARPTVVDPAAPDAADAADAGQPMPRAVGELARDGYTVPVDRIEAGERRVFRHLLRFSQQGEFRVPAAQIWTMYEPGRRSAEAGAAVQTWRVR